MSETTPETHQTSLLQIFAKSKDGRLSAGQLKTKSGKGSKKDPHAGLSPSQADHALTALIDLGLLATSGGSKDAPHPRPNASYRITDKGRHHLRPSKPDHSDELLENQEAFILLKFFMENINEYKLTRSKLNGKLKTVMARGKLEFDLEKAPETVDYHLNTLVEKDCLTEQRRGISVSYTLDLEQGIKALATIKHYENLSITMTGETLNALLAAVRESESTHPAVKDSPFTEKSPTHSPEITSKRLGPGDVERCIEQLRSGPFAGKDLVPIHEVRRLVAEEHGAEAASHLIFDPILMEMRSNEQVELIAISDNRRSTSEQLNDSIPGMNETIFYIVVE